MSYQIIKTFVYVVSVMLSMWGLSCFNFDNIIRKAKVREFYLFFLSFSFSLLEDVITIEAVLMKENNEWPRVA